MNCIMRTISPRDGNVPKHAFRLAPALRTGLTLGCLSLLLGWGQAGAATVPDPSEAVFRAGFISHLKITIPPEGIKVLENYHQVWGQPRPEREDVRATIEEGTQVYTNVAVHLKGSYTYQDLAHKPSLTLNFDKFASGQTFHGLDKIHLNNSVQDPTYLCEKISRELFQAAGVPAARVGHAKISLNGRSLGFYILVEGYNKRFVKRHFPSTRGNLYDGGSGGDITKALEADSGEDRTNRSDLLALVAACRERGASNRMAHLEKVLDVDRFLSFAALESMLLHWDGYCLGPNNYRVFHDASQGRMVFLPHGLDQILGTGQNVQKGIPPKWDGLAARALLSLPDARRRYLERVEQILTNHFTTEKLLTKVDQIAERIRPTAAPGIIERLRYQAAVEGLKSRISHRIAEIRTQLTNREAPLAFGPEGVVRLRGWRFRETPNNPMVGEQVEEEGKKTLVVQAQGNWASGSWRKTVLLDAGSYDLQGLARVDGLPLGATNSGVVLRISGERDATNLVVATAWTPLQYQFELPGPTEVEFVCEFRGAEGKGLFDLGSLRLRATKPKASAK